MTTRATGFSHSNSDVSLQTRPTPECALTLRSAPTGETAAIVENAPPGTTRQLAA